MTFFGGVKNKLRIKNELVRIFIAEVIGTMLLVSIGCGSIAQHKVSKEKGGEFLSINLAWALAVVVAAFVAGGVSGAHINPAISLALALVGKLPLQRLPIYMVAQYLGAFIGAVVVYITYIDGINALDGGIRYVGGVNDTAGIFGTYPQEYMSAGMGFVDQMMGTLVLTMLVAAVTDPRNMSVPTAGIPWVIGGCIAVIGMSFGFNCGYAINPARDLGPRVFTAIAGWGGATFSHRNYNWFWVPIIGPHVGAILGAFLYLFLIENHWPQRDEDAGEELEDLVQDGAKKKLKQ